MQGAVLVPWQSWDVGRTLLRGRPVSGRDCLGSPGLHAGPAGPHGAIAPPPDHSSTGLGCGDTPLAALLSEGCPHVLSSASTVQMASRSFFQAGENDPHPDRFSKPGKTILIPIVFPSRGKRSSSRSFFQAGENDPHPDRFSKPGKTILIPIVFPSRGKRSSSRSFFQGGKNILDPSMRTVHTPPGLAVDRPDDEKGTSQIHVETLYERPLQRLQQPAGTVDKARFFGALVFCGINRASP